MGSFPAPVYQNKRTDSSGLSPEPATARLPPASCCPLGTPSPGRAEDSVMTRNYLSYWALRAGDLASPRGTGTRLGAPPSLASGPHR